MDAAEVLLESLRGEMARLFRCGGENIPHWEHAVRLAAWLHDTGKANDHFQDMLRTGKTQGVRHELMTWAAMESCAEWLSPCFSGRPNWVRAAVYYSVAGHHLKFPDEMERPGVAVRLLLSHPSFQDVLRLGAGFDGMQTPPEYGDAEYSLLQGGALRAMCARVRRELDDDHTPEEKRLIAAVKATLIAADLAGSALPRGGMSLQKWVRSRLEKSLDSEALRRFVETRLAGRAPRPFQVSIRDSSAHTLLVEAGCGTGKTAAAYLWASRRADGRRLFFCYPTTATASEGFSGYLHDPDFDALLVHGRADVDYDLLENLPPRSDEERILRTLRMEALETWPFPAVVCTAHTVLGILENTRRGLFAWPSLAQSVFVFDEIHAFSDTLFAYLLRFMGEFPGVPMLLMTATLPPARREALRLAAESRGTWQIIGGPEEREAAPRYRILRASPQEAWRAAGSVIQAGGKVLWISNTVARAMSTMRTAEELGIPAEPFHSRYRYRDRLRRQRMVIDGFAPAAPPFLALTTQVAEMSLDLSADLLVTEQAPVPAMIQRMGRLNRFADRPRETAPALVTEPDSLLPYTEEEFQGSDAWLDRVADGEPKSQRDLARAFVECSGGTETVIRPAPRCEWIDGLWQSAIRRGVEEASPSVEVLREEDAGLGRPMENAIPMPFPRGREHWQWPWMQRFLVAPAESLHYDERSGAKWKQ
ncbi:MAG TPA: CRISPR-associated helicase Cas3', partial [Candidatus Hydrogenedentes bacterium]|nr:CRISPR-associated helicase Cas3' [Candidatus Hydrogenedentota bacterium]